MKEGKIHFKGFNAMRAIAALTVVVVHTLEFSDMFGFNDLTVGVFRKIEHFSYLAVDFFFVLSGFLITYLLMVEKEKYGKISIREFYIRRILRIWPLYYLLFFIAFVVCPFLPNFDAEIKNIGIQLLLYGTFFANLAYVLGQQTAIVGVTWSVAVEEQFYLIWPYFSKKASNFNHMALKVIFGYLSVKFFLFVLDRFVFHENNQFIHVLFQFVEVTKIDLMAIGALGSIYLYNNGPSKIQAINKYIIIGFLLFVIWFSYQHFYLTQFYNEIHGILFTFVLLIIATRPKIANLLENRLSIFLGNISYGIYMLHMVVVVFSATYLKFLWANNHTLESFILLELFVITVTIFISWISYTFFEKRFLSLKKKFTKVQSG